MALFYLLTGKEIVRLSLGMDSHLAYSNNGTEVQYLHQYRLPFWAAFFKIHMDYFDIINIISIN
ncbi:hypothetical protein AD943_12385 [Gluconobacter roseus]|nr:hypothetical protein AD943_12385 [Gluconobacter roseus]